MVFVPCCLIYIFKKCVLLTFKWNITKQTSKQNITRDIDIKNKLTETRGEVGRHNGGERWKGFQEQL